MFDFRYHALSLVAVFMALMLGILLGVAIGDKGLLSRAQKDIVNSLRNQVRNTRAGKERLERTIAQRDRFENELYPLVVQGRLNGQRVGLIAIGGLSDSTIRNVRDALKDTGARLTLEAVVNRPPRLNGLSPRDTGVRGKPLASDPRGVTKFARRFGAGLTQGGILVKRTRRTVLGTSSGSFDGLEAVVVVRDKPSALGEPDATVARAFEDGLITGLSSRNVSVVGVEATTTDPSEIAWYRSHRLASVDDIDKLAGKVALVFTLAGASGAYGVKDSAEALLPKAASGGTAG
ncbi:MAG: copper transporter [Actinomycetota bacterium]|nr:copper transporter [Actinomycetota bacterium]